MEGSSRWRGLSIYLQTGASVPAPTTSPDATATSQDTTHAARLPPIPRPPPSPVLPHDGVPQRRAAREGVQMLMELTSIEVVEARVILHENSWQLVPSLSLSLAQECPQAPEFSDEDRAHDHHLDHQPWRPKFSKALYMVTLYLYIVNVIFTPLPRTRPGLA